MKQKYIHLKKQTSFILLVLLIGISFSCNQKQRAEEKNNAVMRAKPEKDLVIAHRGTTFYAPEETEAAMRWARNIGAHYLEFDLQRSKDGYLLALHDDNLNRTTDVAIKFPERKDDPVSEFTYEELLTLDAGSWFNEANPEQARPAFSGLDILTLEDVTQIALGMRIKRDASGKRIMHRDSKGKLVTEYVDDPADNGNRPGIYPETKVPALFPGIEEDLKHELTRLGWYHDVPEKVVRSFDTSPGKVDVAKTDKRVILQTFSKESLRKLNETFGSHVPICFLLWRGTGFDDIPDDVLPTYREWVEFGKNNGASIIGPSIGGEPNNYADLLKKEHAEIIREAGLEIHAYSFDSWEQMEEYHARTDGMFTNKADEAIRFYRTLQNKEPGQKPSPDAEEVLIELGY